MSLSRCLPCGTFSGKNSSQDLKHSKPEGCRCKRTKKSTPATAGGRIAVLVALVVALLSLAGTDCRPQCSPCAARPEPVVSRNSNEAIGQCASRLLDDPRRLVSPYTPLRFW